MAAASEIISRCEKHANLPEHQRKRLARRKPAEMSFVSETSILAHLCGGRQLPGRVKLFGVESLIARRIFCRRPRPFLRAALEKPIYRPAAISCSFFSMPREYNNSRGGNAGANQYFETRKKEAAVSA